MTEMHKLLKLAVDRGASDLHISSGSSIMLREHGVMTKLEDRSAEKTVVQNLLEQVLTPRQATELEKYRELDFALYLPEIGRLPDVMRELIDLENGVILVTGPTGSGKSTTLAAMIDYINTDKDGHIITVEDPIEFIHYSKKCLVNQREVGTDTPSFASALRSALREDPDYILVGEMRDLETIALALTAAETGHLVFGTLHTSSAPKTVTRVIDAFPMAQQDQIRIMFSDSIQGIIAQKLYPKKDQRGRVAAFEILVATQAMRNLIREQKIYQLESVIQTGRQYGMQSLEQSRRKLVSDGVLSPEFLEDRMTLY
jgi:twitching motility protein PilT